MRSRRVMTFMLFVSTFVLLGAGCQQDPLSLIRLGDAQLVDLGVAPDEGPLCTPTNKGIEICDEIDNDCDGVIDEGFNLQADPQNCGKCGNSCLKKGSLTTCELGVCKDLGCAPGFYDIDQDRKNGCEYECTPSGPERCDGLDNDCNNEIDETFDTTTDVNNCGQCGHACALAHAIPKCVGGKCLIQSCEAGFINKDGDESNGCERPCKKSHGGVEICDGKDNDCNGVVDDLGGIPVDFQTDPLNCGGCNVKCLLANATAKCVKAKCVLEACKGAYKNADGDEGNGCECLATGIETCDGVDNDCNGKVDDGLPSLGSCGSATGECKKGLLQCQNGIAVCVGAKGPSPETCNGKDDDCNGKVDDKLPPSFGVCGSDVGECRTGNIVCSGGKKVCVGDVKATQEVCDGKDNDCNGTADDGLPASFGSCGTNTGTCTTGTRRCIAGALICVGATGPKTEYCDGQDTDCDGALDDPACVFAATGREHRLSEPGVSLGSHNSGQLAIACDGADVFAVWLDHRNDLSDELHGDLFSNRSSDGSKTWRTSDVAVATETESKVEPVAAFGGPQGTSKRLYVAYSRFASGGRRDVYLRRSTDGGATWKSPVRLDSLSNDSLFVRLAVHPGASASDKDVVVVCWEEINTSGVIKPNIRCNRSRDSGVTFDGDHRVNATAGDAILPEIAVDDAYLYVTWQQGSQITVARATLAGASLSFNRETTLSPEAGKEPKIAVDGQGTVLVVWEDLRLPLSSIRASRSTNRGVNWPSDGVRVDKDVVDGNSVDPVVAFRPGGRAFVVWSDTSRGAHDIYANSSADGGASWGVVASRVSQGSIGVATSSSPRVVVSAKGHRVFVVWEDLRDGTERDIYVNQSLDDGVTWNIPDARVDEALPAGGSDAHHPQICLAGGRVAVIWLEHRSGSAGSYTTGENADVYASYLE